MNRNRIADHLHKVLRHSAFDVDAFSQMPVEGAMDTVRVAVDEGDYPGIVDDYKLRPVQGKKDPNQHFMFMDLLWNIDNEEQRQKTGRDKLIVRQSLSLDMIWAAPGIPSGFDLSTGKNVDLGRVREALGLNIPGQPFRLDDLKGRGPALCHVTKRKEGDDFYNDVTRVTRI